jgi:hypothetical protein
MRTKTRDLRSVLSWLTTFGLSGVLLFTACEISSPDDVTRQVTLNVSGSYTNGSGIAGQQSGSTITLLSITQSGDQLFAVDNLGARWTGSIGRADGNVATVNLRGLTNSGVEVVIAGAISIDGTTGTLSGTWIEPNLRSTVNATANGVAPVPTAVPTAVPTQIPGATATPIPGATATPIPGATATPIPEPTATPIPGATSTPIPVATATPIPGSTPTPFPTISPPPLPGS